MASMMQWIAKKLGIIRLKRLHETTCYACGSLCLKTSYACIGDDKYLCPQCRGMQGYPVATIV